MKKLLSLLVAFGMVAALTACAGGADSTASDSTASDSTASETTETPAEETAETAEAGTVLTHEEYMAADVDTLVTIETYVQAKQSWWEDKATVYAQSEDGAYFLYDMACSEEDYEKLTPGTCIRVTGYKAEWSGEVEIMEGTFEFVEGADTFVAEPLAIYRVDTGDRQRKTNKYALWLKAVEYVKEKHRDLYAMQTPAERLRTRLLINDDARARCKCSGRRLTSFWLHLKGIALRRRLRAGQG